MKCTAHRTNGQPCNAPAIKGGSVCRVHGGSAPQVKHRAKLRLLELVDPALAQLSKRVKDDTNPALALKAAMDILDRNGFKAVEKAEINVTLLDALRHGDISRLDDEALNQLTKVVERLAFGEDRARMLEEKRRTLIKAGAGPEVIDAIFEEATAAQPQEHTAASTETDNEEGW